MCKGAQKTHKRSGAQAQAKRLIPQNGKKENKGLNENGHEEFNLTRKVPRDCLRERAVMNLKKNKKEIKLN
jgi:hypothetical protein